MSVESITISVLRNVSNYSNISEINNDTLISTLAIDNLDAEDVKNDLEEKFQIKINSNDMEKWKTVNDIIKYCKSKTKLKFDEISSELEFTIL